MANFSIHGFGSPEVLPLPMILKGNKSSYSYAPSSRRPSVFLRWTAQYIILGVPSNWQFPLDNINRCWTMPISILESLTHQPLTMMQETSFYVLLSNYGSCGTRFLTLYISWRSYALHSCNSDFHTGNSNPGLCRDRGTFRKAASIDANLRVRSSFGNTKLAAKSCVVGF